MDSAVALVPLASAEHESVFGGKAVSLGTAMRSGLPVPSGIALAADLVQRVAAEDAHAIDMLLSSSHLPPARMAVRSSAVGEDSAQASFAGQHATKLNVMKIGLLDAVREVWASGRTESAVAYRVRKGLPPEPRIGVVVQALVEPRAAGVLFTRNPLTGASERLIEAAWGLGEAVVNGTVVPDRFRIDDRGLVVDASVGEKDVQISYDESDGTMEVAVPDHLRLVSCLSDDHLAALHDLAARCQRVWGDALDLEWAFGQDDTLYLLQCRPITTLRTAAS